MKNAPLSPNLYSSSDDPAENVSTVDQKDEMVKLITQSFCRELVNFGVPKNKLPSIAAMVLDYVMDKHNSNQVNPAYESSLLDRAKIAVAEDDDTLSYELVTIRSLTPDSIPAIAHWLDTTDVQRHFAVLFPSSRNDLRSHFFANDSNSYHGIFYKDMFVGVIGGEQIDHRLRRLQMKKFIGDQGYRGLGIGKTATFLWLHHVFDNLNFHKVFIYTLDTNIRNINLNSHLGFELEGILSDDAIVDGEYCDVARMSLLKTRWSELFPD